MRWVRSAFGRVTGAAGKPNRVIRRPKHQLLPVIAEQINSAQGRAFKGTQEENP